MLFTQDLEELIFHRHEMHLSDELIILSGYLGPKPVARLVELPFNSTVIYGMYGSEGIKPSLHQSLLSIQNNVENLNLYYSKLAIHSKCYVWRNRGEIVHALIGSANFSTNGLTTPIREVLAETTHDTFRPLNNYLQHILNNSISCLEVGNERVVDETPNSAICLMSLLDRASNMPVSSGLNWGQNPNNHTTPDDAYIAIRMKHINNYPNLFQVKQIKPSESRTDNRGRIQRHNDAIEIIWDDGMTMEGLLEGSQKRNGLIYPKQVSSFPVKAQLGQYIRNRIGVPLGQPVRKHHLENYGRTNIAVSLIADGVYHFDFSV